MPYFHLKSRFLSFKNWNLVIQWFPAILTILSRISVKLLATMGTSVIKEMWNQARKSYYNANANERFPKICQQHNYGTANHQRVSHFSGLFHCHFTHSAASIAFDLLLTFRIQIIPLHCDQFYRNFGLYEKSPNRFLPGLPRSIVNQFCSGGQRYSVGLHQR